MDIRSVPKAFERFFDAALCKCKNFVCERALLGWFIEDKVSGHGVSCGVDESRETPTINSYIRHVDPAAVVNTNLHNSIYSITLKARKRCA